MGSSIVAILVAFAVLAGGTPVLGAPDAPAKQEQAKKDKKAVKKPVKKASVKKIEKKASK